MNTILILGETPVTPTKWDEIFKYKAYQSEIR